MPSGSYNPRTGSLAYACLVELYRAGACPSGNRGGLKKDALLDFVQQGGLSVTSPEGAVVARNNHKRYHKNNLDLSLTSLNKHRSSLLKHVKGKWELLAEGERVARDICLKDGIPLPDVDAHNAPPQQQQAQGPPAAATLHTPGRQPRPAAGPGARRSPGASSARQHPITPSRAAALQRLQQQQQQQQAQQQAAVQGAPGGCGASLRLAGSKRAAPDGTIDIDLVSSGDDGHGGGDSDDDDDIATPNAWRIRCGSGGTGAGSPSGQQAVVRQLDGSFDRQQAAVQQVAGSSRRKQADVRQAAGPSNWQQARQPVVRQLAGNLDQQQAAVQQLAGASEWQQAAVQQLIELLPHLTAEAARAALERQGGDVQAAADYLLDGGDDREEVPVPAGHQAAAAGVPAAGGQPRRHPPRAAAAPVAARPFPGAAAAGAAAGEAVSRALSATAAAQRQAQGGLLSGGDGGFDAAAAWGQQQPLALPPLAAGQRFADCYDVVLLVDCCERQRAQVDLNRCIRLLRKRGAAVESRRLPVGDVLWVARARDGSGSEYVLDYVLERKSSPDLCSSIKDGRYTGQKWRMLACGLVHRLYLVETDGDRNLSPHDKKAVMTARTTTQVVDGFAVLYSKDFAEARVRPTTIDWYANLTASIARRYAHASDQAQAGTASCSTPGGRRAMTVAQLEERVRQEEQGAAAGGGRQWQLMLMAVPWGGSQGAAEAIAARYPSPSSLLRAVRQAGHDAVVTQLAALRCHISGQQLISEAAAGTLLRLLFPTQRQQQAMATAAEVVEISDGE